MILLATLMSLMSMNASSEPLAAEPASRIVATGDTPGVAKCVTVEGRYVYVGYRGGMSVFDLADPASPELVDDLDFGDAYVNEIKVIGDRAYLAAGFNGVIVVDLSNAARPKQLSEHGKLGEVMGIDVHGTKVYVTSGIGLITLETNRDGILTVLKQRSTGLAQCVQFVNNSIFVSSRRYGLSIFEPLDNHHAKDVSVTRTADEAFGFDIVGNIAYVCDQDTGFTTMDISDTRWPKYLSTIELPGFAIRVDVEGTRAYVASTDAGIHVIDVYDPAAPRLIEQIHGLEWAFDIEVVGRHGFVADGRGGFKVIEFARD